MKTAKHIIAFVFGLLGVIYAAIGFVMMSIPADDPEVPLVGSIFAPLGVAFLLVAALVWYFISRSERRRQEVLAYGIRVRAVVTDIRINYSVKVNRRSPITVYAQCIHPVSRETVTLRSHNLWNATIATGDKVDICFDQMNEKLYAFDIPEEASK